MRKSTLFISAVLTTFMLAILVGVVSAYKNTLNTTGTKVQQSSTAVVADLSTATTAPSVTGEEAAALAAQVIGRTDLYSVESTPFNNADAYLVTFTSGDLVYVSLGGQILSIGKLAPVYVSAPATPVKNKNKNKRQQTTQPPTQPPTGGGGGDGGGDGEGGGD
jgi:hypothetical protein